MVISRKRTPSLTQTLTLRGSDLERVQCFKYLGLLLCANLFLSTYSQLAQRPGKSLDFLTKDSTTMLMVLPYYHSISHWSGIT